MIEEADKYQTHSLVEIMNFRKNTKQTKQNKEKKTRQGNCS